MCWLDDSPWDSTLCACSVIRGLFSWLPCKGGRFFLFPLSVTPPEWKQFSKSYFGIVGRGILTAGLSTIHGFQAEFE